MPSSLLRFFIKTPRDKFPPSYKFLPSGKIICRSCRAELEPIGSAEENKDAVFYQCQHLPICKVLPFLSTETTTNASTSIPLSKLKTKIRKILPKDSFVLLFIPKDGTPLHISSVLETMDVDRLDQAYKLFQLSYEKESSISVNLDLEPTL